MTQDQFIEFQQETLKDLQYLLDQLKGAPDRTCALVAFSLVERSLRQLLKMYFIPDCRSTEELIPSDEQNEGRGLTGFQLLRLAHAIGCITEFEFEQCNSLRNIRNLFAHSFQELTFSSDNEVLKKNLRKLSTNLPTMFVDNAEISEERKLFCSVAVVMTSFLRYSRPQQIQVQRTDPDTFYLDKNEDGSPRFLTGAELNERMRPAAKAE